MEYCSRVTKTDVLQMGTHLRAGIARESDDPPTLECFDGLTEAMWNVMMEAGVDPREIEARIVVILRLMTGEA